MHTQNTIISFVLLLFAAPIIYANCKLNSTVESKHPTANAKRINYSSYFLCFGLVLRFFFLSIPDFCEWSGWGSVQRNSSNWSWIMMMTGMTEIFSYFTIIFYIYNMYKLDEEISGPFN